MATIKRTNDMERTLYEILGDLLYWYEHTQWDLDTYLSRRTEWLHKHPYWKRVPMYVRYGLCKVEEYRTDKLIRDNTYFAYVFDNQPVTFDDWRAANPDGNAQVVFDNNRPRGTFWKSTNKPHHVTQGI
jgi:hypothetical protein